ncbi:MarR family transcriptional regulator [Amycolatopsis mediterranei S699]|uniref:MarR family transcriptional regulator n=2 Tax=Amycolatopsis mediterranei TaxID=33910 RepID=A0A0H3CYR5_AMYMU|nr:MarR family transcriptional regulator [Amycolatopsis mediterranei]ADJ43230.1 MarR family transcriptional regulator [Amycolatopsis mediterranei U32]AEK39928.1 MarR family transcriptional regulator [Amycolatopsis mediterranei S699]AFO74943.1 MarR family transcriptional regulator [Amycolatopsis mediterranei S699]AGT82072.1 MarR family transcriptional regulator [Amycolatopsis mediterranei RB]KDO05142.1 MarR family transcriptional regulator [Amycolatopsis mediterranei]
MEGRDAGRELSTAVVAFHEAVGASLGVTAVDQRALAVIAGAGSVSAGDLAKEIGLTPGAVTGVVDRLERAGLAHRAPDPADRRRLVITAVPGAFRKLFAGLDAAMAKLMARYSPAEQAVIAGWVANTAEILREQTRLLTKR